MTKPLTTALHPVRFGLVLSLMAILAGFTLGGVFGALEDDLKAGLRADAMAVLDSAYGGDQAAAKKVYDKAWAYHKRAHMHWGGIGAATLAVGTLLGLVGGAAGLRTILSLLLGIGAIGYPLAWLVAGRAAPGLGGTGAAKEAYEWLFIGASAPLLLGLAASIVVIAKRLNRAPSR